jgi:hypothetical protein
MAVRGCSWIQEHLLHGNGIFKLVPRWDKCIGVLRDYVSCFIVCEDHCSQQEPHSVYRALPYSSCAVYQHTVQLTPF